MKICVQTANVVDDFGPEAAFPMLRNCGFEAVDLTLNFGLQGDDYRFWRVEKSFWMGSMDEILSRFDKTLQLIKENSLTIGQAHGPYPAYRKGMPQVEQDVIPIYEKCVRLCAAAGCGRLVIHGIGAHPEEPELTGEALRQKNLRLYKGLIPVLRETGVTVCLENAWEKAGNRRYEAAFANPLEAVWYIDELNKTAGQECFGLCLDTGHLNLLRKNIREYIRIVGPRIQALHIHDNDGVEDLHLMPFSGTVRWNDFLEGLREIGYQGDLSFETGNQVDLRRMDKEYIPLFLRTIADTGKIFREKILN